MNNKKTIKHLVNACLFFGMLAIFSGCANIYKSPNFAAAKKQHKTVAILPFDVSIDAKRLPKGMTIEMLKEQEKDEAYVVQTTAYTFFLKKMNKYSVTFQDADKTNALLHQANLDYDNLRTKSKDEIAKLLGVDAVISGKIRRTQPMSVAGAIAIGVLTGIGTATNEVNVDFTIHGVDNGELLWKYNHKIQGGLGSSSQRLADSLMKEISRKFPYKKG